MTTPRILVAVAALVLFGCVSAQSATTTPLDFGMTYSGTISEQGEEDYLVFDGVVGQRIYFDSLDDQAGPRDVELFTPSGIRLFLGKADRDYGPFTLLEAGEYTLHLGAAGEQTGSYGFRVLDLADAPLIASDTTVSLQLSPRLETSFYRFPGNAAQRVTLSPIDYSGLDAVWQLIAPGDQRLGSALRIDAVVGPTALPSNGSYLVAIAGNSPNTTPMLFDFSLSVESDAPVATTLTEAPFSGTILAGEIDTYTFDAPEGLPVYFDSQTTPTSALVVRVLDPSQNLIINKSAGTDVGPLVLPRSGTYTIEVAGSTVSSSGSYLFQLRDLTASPALTFDTFITELLDPAYKADIYQFAGVVGQRIYYDALEADNDNVQVILWSPSGVQPQINGNSDTDAGIRTLREAGDYYLIIQNRLSSITDYEFQVLNVADQPEVDLDTPVVGQLDPGRSVVLLRLEGTAGQRLFLDSSSTSTTADWALISASDQAVPGTSARLDRDIEVTLPVDGTYVLWLSGRGSSPLSYGFRIVTFETPAKTFALNTEVTDSLSEPGERHVYTFEGTVGQRLFYDALDQDSDSTTVRLVSPEGAELFGVSANAETDRGLITLTQAGTYTLILDGTGQALGTYAFRLLDVADQDEVLPDTPTVGFLNPGRSVTLLRLEGTAGQQLFLDSNSTSTRADWALISPSDLLVPGASARLDRDVEITLPVDGTYVLWLSGRDPSAISYAFRIVTFEMPAKTFTLNTEVTDSLSEPGERHSYTFEGTVGQRLFYDALDQNSDSTTVRLVSPEGAELFGVSANAETDRGLITLTQAGTYTLIVDGTGQALGTYAFRLLDVADQDEVVLDTSTLGFLNPGRSVTLLRMQGTAGQKLYLDSTAAGTRGDWALISPSDLVVAGTSVRLDRDAEVTLPVDGTYVLWLSGRDDNAVSYAFRIVTFETPGKTFALDTEVTDSLSEPGERHVYTFEGTVGQRLYYDALDADTDSTVVRIVSPGGAELFGTSANAETDRGPFTLTQAGTYTLILDGSGAVVATYAFRLADLSAAGAYTVGDTLSEALDPKLETDFWQFAGTTGQRVSLQSLGAADRLATWGLIAPTDAVLGSSHVQANPGEFTLPFDGVYHLFVSGTTDGAALPYIVQATDISDTPVAVSGLGTLETGFLSSGTTEDFTFTAPAGHPIYFDGQEPASGVLAQLIAPEGTSLFQIASSSDAGPLHLPFSGTYTLRIKGSNPTQEGQYRFRLLDLVDGVPTVSLDQEITGMITQARQADVYRLPVTTGQRLYYDGLDGDQDRILIQLKQPSGAALISSLNSDNDSSLLTVVQPEIHWLIVFTDRDLAGDYRFKILNLASQPELTLDSPESGVLDPGRSTALLRYTAIPGESLFFDAQGTGGGANWLWRGPQNEHLAGNVGIGSDFSHTTVGAGEHVLIITGASASPVPYLYEVVTSETSSTPLILGDPIDSELSEVGERDIYTFTGSTGQRLYYDALEGDLDRILVTMYDPDGRPVFLNNSNSDRDVGPFTLSATGSYRLEFYSDRALTANYTFRLLDVAAQPNLTLDTSVTGLLDPGRSAVLLRLADVPGTRLFFDALSSTAGATWFFTDPNDLKSSAVGMASDFLYSVQQTGEHVLVLSNDSDTSILYLFEVVTSEIVTQPLVFGDRVTSDIGEAGEQDIYAFNGTSGQRLYYDALESDLDRIFVTLKDPDGRAVFLNKVNSDRDVGPFTLTATGSYRLVISSDRDLTADYDFRLLEIAAQPVLPLDAVVDVTLDPGFSATLFRHAGNPGERLFCDGISSTSGASVWAWADPNNVRGSAVGTRTDFEVVVQSAGVHVLIVSGAETSMVLGSFQVITPDDLSGPNVNSGPVLAPIGDQITGELVLLELTVSGTDGDPVNALHYTLDAGAPPEAEIDSNTGAFSWIPAFEGASRLVPITVRVTDDGNPSLSAAETISVLVIAGPVVLDIDRQPNEALVSWRSAPGELYGVQYTDTIVEPTWIDLDLNIPASDFVTAYPDTSVGQQPQRFYRVLLFREF